MRTCTSCGEEFQLLPNKPGYANVCPNCSKGVKEPQKLMAEVSWEGKHTPIITVTTAAKAIAFNRAQRRSGFTANLRFSAQSTSFEREAAGQEVIGTDYRTRLGESRRVK